MSKKEALTKLKTAFRDPNIATYKLKAIRSLYSEVKEKVSDNGTVPKELEAKINAI